MGNYDYMSDVFNSYYQIGIVVFGYAYGGYVGYCFIALGLLSVPLMSQYRANILTSKSSNSSESKTKSNAVPTTTATISFPTAKKKGGHVQDGTVRRRPMNLNTPSSKERSLSEVSSVSALSAAISVTPASPQTDRAASGASSPSQPFAMLPLTLKELCASNFDQETAPEIVVNALKPQKVESDHFKADVIFKLRTDPLSGHYAPYFEGKNRTFEFQVQGKFKESLEPDDKIWFGIELEGKLTIGLIGRAIMNTVLALCEKLIGGIHSSWGTKDGSEDAHLVFPLESTVDRLIISTPDDEVPPLCIGMLPEPIDKATRKSLVHTYVAENTYTFSMHGMYVDFLKWAAVNFPGKRSIDIRSLLGDLPLRLVAYVQKKGTKAHLNSTKKYLFAFEMTHNGGEVQWVDDAQSVGHLSTATVIPAEALVTTSSPHVNSSVDDIVTNIKEFQESQVQQAISISCPMYVEGANAQRGVWFVIRVTEKIDAEDGTQKTECRSVLRNLSSISDLPMLHTKIHGNRNGFPEWKFKHDETNNAFNQSSLSTHTIELVREDISNYLGLMLNSVEGRKTLAYFLDVHYYTDKQISLLSGGRKDLDMTISYIGGDVAHEGSMGRALCETRWVECWAVCYTTHLCFYSKKSKRYDARFYLNEVLNVEKTSDQPFPAAFLRIHTVGRVHYLAFSDKRHRDNWFNKIQAQVTSTQAYTSPQPYSNNSFMSNGDLSSLQEAYATRSPHRWGSMRTLMNERLMYFGNSTPEAENPCELMENALRLVLNLDEDLSKDQLIVFLDEVSKLKTITISQLLRMESHQKMAFFINMYHCLFAHVLLIFGTPSASSRTIFFQICSYECAGNVFSLAEIEHNILRAAMPRIRKPVKCPHALPLFEPKSERAKLAFTLPEDRLKLVLHWGTSLYGSKVPVFSHKQEVLEDQLMKCCSRIADAALKVNTSSKTVTLPKALESFSGDYANKHELFLGILPFTSNRRKEEILPVMESIREKKIYFAKSDPSYCESLREFKE